MQQQYFLSDFVDIQRKSFFTLLEKGLIEEFSKRNPITNTSKTMELFFYPEYYQLTKPEYTPSQAVVKSKSYTSRLYIPVQLTDKVSNLVKLKWVYIGNIPLMTKRGHFILNGCARVIVNQMIRSPGLYFQKKIYENFADKWSEKPDSIFERYYADLICNRGTWLRLEIDKFNQIWAQMKRVPKIPIMWLLVSMGLPEKIILKRMSDSKMLLYNFQFDEGYIKGKVESIETKKDKRKPLLYVKTPPAAWEAIYKLVSPKKTNKAKTQYKKKSTGSLKQLGRNWIFNKFMNPRTYDLGKVGRLNFNSKLNLSISLTQMTLTPQDVLLATDYLILVSKGLRPLDDIDHLKNRRVRTSGELLQLQIGIGLVRLEKNIKMMMNRSSSYTSPFSRSIPFNKIGQFTQVTSTFSAGQLSNLSNPTNWQKWRQKGEQTGDKLTISHILNTKPFNGALKEFFGSSPLSQFLDQINPLAELTHKRRLSSMGPGGVTRDSATLEIRGIHPSHYGRICPVETPEGKNTGLVNSLTAYARVNSEGYIETPFYKVYKGQVQRKTGLFFFSAKQEENIKLGASDLYTTDIGFLPLASIPTRIAEDFTKISRNQIEFVGVAPIQMISIATSLIPFFEHDDGNRALMGSNMQRQAVPILKPQRPIVGTGLEARAVSDSGHVVQTKQSGVITYVSSTKIVLFSEKA